MADNKIKDEIIKAVTSKVDRSLKSGITQEYVEDLKDRIVTRSRVGIGIDESGRGVRFPRLSDKYIRRRKGSKSIKTRNIIDRNRRKRAKETEKKTGDRPTIKLSSKTTPAKSNITATGQLLDSLTVIKLRLKKAWGFRITVGDRRGRDLFGNPSKIGNKKLVEYLKAQGRQFLGFTKSQRNIIVKEIRNIIIKGLK